MTGTPFVEIKSMQVRDLFGLGVRLFGLWMACQGVTYVASFIDMKLYPSKPKDSAAALLIYATLYFSVAAFFLLWTRVLVDWSYAENEAKPKTEVEPLA